MEQRRVAHCSGSSRISTGSAFQTEKQKGQQSRMHDVVHWKFLHLGPKASPQRRDGVPYGPPELGQGSKVFMGLHSSHWTLIFSIYDTAAFW